MKYEISKRIEAAESSWNDGTHNAIVRSFDIANDDHGFLSGCLHVNYGTSAQGWGGFRLDHRDKDEDVNRPSKVCGAFIAAVLEITGANSVHSVAGRPIRVRKENGLISHIGHFLDDQWFSLKEWCDENIDSGEDES